MKNLRLLSAAVALMFVLGVARFRRRDVNTALRAWRYIDAALRHSADGVRQLDSSGRHKHLWVRSLSETAS